MESSIQADRPSAAKVNEKVGELPLALSQLAGFMRFKTSGYYSCYTKYVKEVQRMADRMARRQDGYKLDLSTV